MAFHYLLLLFPALSLARIDVKVFGEFNGNDKTVKIDYTGSDTCVLSDVERTTFQLDEETLKTNTFTFFGSQPDDVFLHSPTPFGDLYKTYNWDEVTRTVTPKTGRILKVTCDNQTVTSKSFMNTGTKPTTFNVGLTKHLENTVLSFWTKDGDLTINKGINYAIHLGNETISYTSLWGLNTEKSMTTVVGSNDREMILQPGQSVTTELRTTKLTIVLEMEYTTTLAGSMALNYRDSFKEHHFWALDVNEMLTTNGMTNTVESKETIEITFYSNPEVVTFDTMTGKQLTDMIL